MVNLARKADDFIIDQVLQPGADKAERWLGPQVFTLARLCMAIGVMIGLFLDKIVRQALFLRFFEDLLCLSIMAGATYVQINAQQARACARHAWRWPCASLGCSGALHGCWTSCYFQRNGRLGRIPN